jgi:hypothetical protein
MSGAARPGIGRASMDAVGVDPSLVAVMSRERGDGCGNARHSPTSAASRARNLAQLVA